MKAFFTLILFLLAGTAYGQVDNEARKDILELRSRLRNLDSKIQAAPVIDIFIGNELILAVNKNKFSLSKNFRLPPFDIYLEDYNQNDIVFKRGDVDSRRAILELRKYVLFLEKILEIPIKQFQRIDHSYGFLLQDMPDNELRRAILDLRSDISRLCSEIENKKSNNIAAHGTTVPIVSELQSNLPACKGGDMPRWNNCFGTSNYASGNKFVGEFKNGQHNGQGTFTYANGNKYSGEHKDGKFFGQGIFTFTNGIVQIGEWKDEKPHGRFIEYSAGKIVVRSGLFEDGKLITSQFIDPNSFTRISPSSIPLVVSDTQRFDSEQSNLQLEQERRLLSEERRKFDEEKRQREQAKTNQRINLQVNNTQPSAEGDVTITVQTNADTASLKINGEEQGGRPDGNYTLKRVARAGQETRFEIQAKDVYGNTESKTISVSRTLAESKVTYQQLNPERIKRQPERDAVAVIIGISNYKSLPRAEYAKDDAQVFFDYAIRALGVRPGNIKLLMDEQADAEDIYTTFKTWLPARVKSTTDVYVFYSGHGLPTQDGSGLYWLPQRANRDLLAKTAILLQEINSDIQASKPKSVTIFMDACYSGQARGGETLVASARPIALKSQPTTFPSNFTVISASQADQISSSSPELQHGIFSYYLMRGMEGEADLNKDGKITLDEIQAYLSENVGRQARIMNRQQEPQVIGDGSRALVGR